MMDVDHDRDDRVYYCDCSQHCKLPKAVSKSTWRRHRRFREADEQAAQQVPDAFVNLDDIPGLTLSDDDEGDKDDSSDGYEDYDIPNYSDNPIDDIPHFTDHDHEIEVPHEDHDSPSPHAGHGDDLAQVLWEDLDEDIFQLEDDPDTNSEDDLIDDESDDDPECIAAQEEPPIQPIPPPPSNNAMTTNFAKINANIGTCSPWHVKSVEDC